MVWVIVRLQTSVHVAAHLLDLIVEQVIIIFDDKIFYIQTRIIRVRVVQTSYDSVLVFYVPPTAKVKRRRNLGLKSHPTKYFTYKQE